MFSQFETYIQAPRPSRPQYWAGNYISIEDIEMFYLSWNFVLKISGLRFFDVIQPTCLGAGSYPQKASFWESLDSPSGPDLVQTAEIYDILKNILDTWYRLYTVTIKPKNVFFPAKWEIDILSL